MGDLMSKKSSGWEGDDRYLQTEFSVMAKDHGGVLSTGQLTKLLMALGFGGDEALTEMLLKGMHKEREDTITLDEYVEALKSHEDVMVKTSKLRVIFGNFDDANEGRVSKSKIKTRLRVMDFEVDDNMLKAIEETDADKDGYVTYEEFLTKHLKNKGFIPK
ncbi:neo-calmodulin-like [Mizuhopecten yessoensis]|uniref:Calcium-binding mitochondrial carrier protein SCaMC-2 n=1 Tax=Mizuhopecten yessoensis TaxID=6573 RepID=A0A210QTT1_MIZYE|nr:neo-calmodulin-like [Mizuhopecten yessoensis]OWF52158.1 Calcium-binding mitochondrial carrier protein SCaMC-2 [Mizuhopecten yessoensis]